MRNLSIFFLFCCCLWATAVVAEEPSQVIALQQENRVLQRQVRKLEAQVEAMREEMNRPLTDKVISGVGYIFGVFGVAGWLATSRKKREEK